MAGVDILATAFNGANAAFIAEMYSRWVANPGSVDSSFAELFAALDDEARAILVRNKMREKYGLQPEEPEKPYKPINNLASYEEQNEPLVKSDSIVTAQEVHQLSDCGKCSSQWLFFVNIIFLLFGLGALLYGILLLVDSSILGDMGLLSEQTAIVMISVGSCITLLALMGLIGARCQVKCCLKFYGWILLAVVLAQITALILVLTDVVNLDEIVASAYKLTPVDTRLDIQDSSGCCGLYSFNDTFAVLPCPPASITDKVPCLSQLVDNYFKVNGAFGYIYIAVLGLQVIGLLVSWCELCAVRRLREREKKSAHLIATNFE